MASNSVGVEFGNVERMDWQARDTGWLLDDLLVVCRATDGSSRSIGFSHKSDRQITRNGFPADFVDLAWAQWLGVPGGRQLCRRKDALALVTAEIANDVFSDWNALLREILGTSPDRIVSRLQDTGQGTQSSEIQRKLLESFACPARYNHASTSEEAVQLLHHVRVLVFDYGSPTSKDTLAALRDCRSVLSSSSAIEATDLWERLVGIADEFRPIGGTMNLQGLLEKLRSKFSLRDHLSYRADLENLRGHANASMADIESRVARIAHLPREENAKLVRGRLNATRNCLLTGDSGSGKSALLKDVSSDYYLTVWLSRDELDHPTPAALQKVLGLRHQIIDTLNHAPGMCLVVMDGIEGCSERALKLCAALQVMIQEQGGAHVHVACSLQLEAADRVTRLLRSYGVPASNLAATQCERPNSGQVYTLLAAFPELQWISNRPELGPVLTNLKILDWVAKVGPRPLPDTNTPLTTTGIIDDLWALWTEGPDDGHSRSLLLMDVARTEADTLSYGIARTRIDRALQSSLSGLERDDLIRVKDDRVFLRHDLLGHWARLKVLIAENPSELTHLRQQALSPLWQPAIRLFGQRLLEGSDESRARWPNALNQQSKRIFVVVYVYVCLPRSTHFLK